MAQITDASNVSSQVEGLVERNGLLWVEHLPLGPGANTLSLTMSNAAGLTNTLSLTVTQSDVTITINEPSGGELKQPHIWVMGTINTNGYTVWVNGMEVTNVWANGGGTWGWQVEGVPVNEGGTAVIQARAIPNTDNGGHGTGGSGGTNCTMVNPGNPSSAGAQDKEVGPDKPAQVVKVHYGLGLTDFLSVPSSPETYTDTQVTATEYELGFPGHASFSWCYGKPSDQYWTWEKVFWDERETGTYFLRYPVRGAGVCGDEQFDATGPCLAVRGGSESCKVQLARPEAGGWRTRVRKAHTLYELHTGGKALSQRNNLFLLSATAQGVGNYFWPEVDSQDLYAYSIDPSAIILGEFGQQGSDGRIYKVLADNTTHDITPWVPGNPYYTFPEPAAPKHRLILWACTAVLEPDKVVEDAKFCVGQQLWFVSTWRNFPPYAGEPPGIRSNSYDWVMSAKYVNRQSPSNSAGCVTYDVDPNVLKQWMPTAWYISGGDKDVRLNLHLFFENGQNAKLTVWGKFNVFRPTIALVPFGTTPSFFPNYHGAVPGIQLGGDGDPRDGHHEMAYYVDYDSGGYLGTGTGGIVQLLTANYSARPSLTFSDWRLDGSSVLYSSAPIDPFANPPRTEVSFDDEPSNYQPFIFSTIWVQASFQDYCMFKPDAGSPNQNIFVTLGIITWSCDGELSQIHIGEPGFPGIKVTKDNVVGPDGPVESDQFPTWEKNCPEGARQ